MRITNIITISKITSQRFIPHQTSVHLLFNSLFLAHLYPGGAAGKRDIDHRFVNRCNYCGFLRKWIDCGYSVGGDCGKGSGRLLTAWPFVLARVREIWQIGRVVVRDFSRRAFVVGKVNSNARL